MWLGQVRHAVKDGLGYLSFHPKNSRRKVGLFGLVRILHCPSVTLSAF